MLFFFNNDIYSLGIMWLWFCSYLAVNAVILVYYYKKAYGVFHAPFLMAYTALFVLLPQFATIYNNPYYDKRLIPDLGIVMLSCNVAFTLGFEVVKWYVPERKDVIGILHIDKVKPFMIVMAAMGFATVFLWSGAKFQEGDNVIAANMKEFSQIAVCMPLIAQLAYQKWNKFALYIFVLSVIPSCYFAFFIKGSRGETLFLLLTIGLFLALRYPLKEPVIKKCTLAILLAGALFSASIVWVRSVINGSAHTEVSLIDNFVGSFSMKKVSLGMDLGNVAIGIRHLKEINQMDYGTYLYDDFIQNAVPRRIVGESFKEGLKLNLVKDKEFISRHTHSVTTMTGYYFAFRSFSYLGFLLFFLYGAFYGFAYCRRRDSALCLYLYLWIMPVVPLMFTHSFGYLYSRLYLGFVISCIFCHKAFKRYKITSNG